MKTLKAIVLAAGVALGAVAGMVGAAEADAIPIQNPTFAAYKGWVAGGTGGVGSLYSFGYRGADPVDTVAWMNHGSIYQYLTGYTLLADETYTFSFDVVGRPYDLPGNGNALVWFGTAPINKADAQLGVPLISFSDFSAVTRNNWLNYSGTFTTSSSTPDLGQTLEIYAWSNIAQLDVTDFSLTGVAGNGAVGIGIGDTPEMPTYLMGLLGLAGIALLRRRRLQA